MDGGGNGRMRFGDFEFNSLSGELFREGRSVKIQPQPLRVLSVLIERPGEIVFREQLRTRVGRPNEEVLELYRHGRSRQDRGKRVEAVSVGNGGGERIVCVQTGLAGRRDGQAGMDASACYHT
jgi:hypothetical protein